MLRENARPLAICDPKHIQNCAKSERSVLDHQQPFYMQVLDNSLKIRDVTLICSSLMKLVKKGKKRTQGKKSFG